MLDGVEVIRYRYAPEQLETLVNHGGIVTNLRRSGWKAFLLPGFILMQGWYMWRLTRARTFDVIHAHWILPQGLLAALLRRCPGRAVPFVVTSHGADLYALNQPWLQRLKRFVMQESAAMTVVSGAMRKRIEAMGGDAARIEVMPMGVDLHLFSPDANLRRSSKEILFVGRLVEKKGLSYLVEALSKVRNSIPDVRLTIAGFGPEEHRLKKQIEALNLNVSVNFIGAVTQDELPALYQKAALFVAPFIRAESGDEEGLGLVVVEAIGCGCPVLVGNVPAAYDVLGDQFSHLAIDPRDVESLSCRIERALIDNDTREHAKVLRRSVSRRFDWPIVANGYARLLLKVAGRNDLI